MRKHGDNPADKRVRQGDPATRSAGDAGNSQLPPEFGGPEGPEPTRYGDWERRGRCSDF